MQTAKNLLDRTLADEDVGLVTPFENDRHPASLEVEWNLVDLAELLVGLQLLVKFDVLQDRVVEQVLETRTGGSCSDRRIRERGRNLRR